MGRVLKKSTGHPAVIEMARAKNRESAGYFSISTLANWLIITFYYFLTRSMYAPVVVSILMKSP